MRFYLEALISAHQSKHVPQILGNHPQNPSFISNFKQEREHQHDIASLEVSNDPFVKTDLSTERAIGDTYRAWGSQNCSRLLFVGSRCPEIITTKTVARRESHRAARSGCHYVQWIRQHVSRLFAATRQICASLCSIHDDRRYYLLDMHVPDSSYDFVSPCLQWLCMWILERVSW